MTSENCTSGTRNYGQSMLPDILLWSSEACRLSSVMEFWLNLMLALRTLRGLAQRRSIQQGVLQCAVSAEHHRRGILQGARCRQVQTDDA